MLCITTDTTIHNVAQHVLLPTISTSASLRDRSQFRHGLQGPSLDLWVAWVGACMQYWCVFKVSTLGVLGGVLGGAMPDPLFVNLRVEDGAGESSTRACMARTASTSAELDIVEHLTSCRGRC